MTHSIPSDVPHHHGSSTEQQANNVSSATSPPTSSHHNVNIGSHDRNDSNSVDDRKMASFVHKSILQSDALYQYILDTSVYPRESQYQRELREITEKYPRNEMALPADEGQFLMLLVKLINAKNTLELGVYTGYSLLSTALALPNDGKIIAMDMNRQAYELGAPILEKAGVSHKVDFREGLILPQLDAMLLQEANFGFFDFVFVDADKGNYLNYHKRAIKLVKVGGVIGYDNTLWSGSLVAPEDAPYPEYVHRLCPFVLEFNQVLAGDERVEISQVPIGDGITLCRRVK